MWNFSSGYVDHQMPEKAVELFAQVEHPNEILLVLFCNACAQLATPEALQSLTRVSSSVSIKLYSNVHLLTSSIDAFMKCGDVQRAEALFRKSKTRVVAMYGAMMKGTVVFPCGSNRHHRLL